MIPRSSDGESIRESFQDLQRALMKVFSAVSGMTGGKASPLSQEVLQISDLLKEVEQSVSRQAEVRQSRLEELMNVGRAINSSLGLKQVLDVVMDSLIKLMRAERGFLMLRDPGGGLSMQAARGMARSDLDEDEFAFSKTVVKTAIEMGDPVLTTNAQNDARFAGVASVVGFHFRSILCAPLKLRDELIGVIYVDNRALSEVFQEDDKRLIAAFADQAAVAIDNARLIDNLKSTNEELADANAKLENAYQATLEGWVRALDLRDKETEGHTRRVTTLTRRLAQRLGVGGDDLIHLTRGALLHDIGKMAIPDGILLKPGELTEEERALIRRHPQYAYDMLQPIEFLRPALDIPYCHHERWDGTGYPNRLEGEEIPYPARIFPIIDVWDALISDRPYRKGLPPAEVRERIRAESGRHFDPRIVVAFMEMDDLSV
jgi:HD-GYP domain-containing protein (c-di-GMP phosphodiesterase class II)